MDTNYFARLNQINVSDHVEKKGDFSYLSWPYAVAQLRLADPAAFWEVRRFDGLPYLKTETGYFVEVAVTVQGVTLSQIHPVLDGKNRPIFEPTAFDINTSIQRCLVKAIALHGLGLYVYAGEDLPDGEKRRDPTNHRKPRSRRSRIGAHDHRRHSMRYLERLLDETGSDLEQGAGLLRRAVHCRAADRAQSSRAIKSLEQASGGQHEHHRQARPRQRRVARASAQPPQRQRDARRAGRVAVA